MLEFEIQHTLLSNIRQPLLEFVQRPETFVDGLLLAARLENRFQFNQEEVKWVRECMASEQSVEKRRHPVFVCLHPCNVRLPRRWMVQEFGQHDLPLAAEEQRNSVRQQSIDVSFAQLVGL